MLQLISALGYTRWLELATGTVSRHSSVTPARSGITQILQLETVNLPGGYLALVGVAHVETVRATLDGIVNTR